MAAPTSTARSAERWGPLWGARPRDWAGIEDQQRPTYEEAIRRAGIAAGQRVLDIGCGTGTLAVLIKRLYPDVEVAGLDPDPKALARARRKTGRAHISVRFDQGFSDSLPYPEASFDRVFSSFMFHHLPAAEKEQTLREARRVLKPAGSFHLLDFVGADAARHGFLARVLHSSPRLADNSEARMLALMQHAGFGDPLKVADRTMLHFIRTAYYRASAA